MDRQARDDEVEGPVVEWHLAHITCDELAARTHALDRQVALRGLRVVARLIGGPDDAVLEKLRAPAQPARDWRDQVVQLSTAMWLGIRAHPRLVPLMVMRPARSPEARALGDALIAALQRGGYRAKALRAAVRAVSAFIVGFALAEFHGPLPDESVSEKQLTSEFQAGIEALLAAGEPSER